TAIAVWNFDLYFRQYANAPDMRDAFYYRQHQIANQLLTTTSPKRRYILFDKGKPEVLGLPTDAHTIIFLTSTLEPKDQDKKNIHYGYIGDIVSSDTIEVIALPEDALH